MNSQASLQSNDLLSHAHTYGVVWGLPVLLIVAGNFLHPSIRTGMWLGALMWMGVTCWVNTARCGRTHCYFTGPYFLALAILPALHGWEILWLGAYGWLWLTLMIFAGGGALWFVTEKVWGKFF